jgi:hypothetical protein
MEPTYIWSCKCQQDGGAYSSATGAREHAEQHLAANLAHTGLHTAYLGRAADSITLTVGTTLDSDPHVVL